MTWLSGTICLFSNVLGKMYNNSTIVTSVAYLELQTIFKLSIQADGSDSMHVAGSWNEGDRQTTKPRTSPLLAWVAGSWNEGDRQTTKPRPPTPLALAPTNRNLINFSKHYIFVQYFMSKIQQFYR